MFESVTWPTQPTDKALAANAEEQYWRSNASPFILLIKKHSKQQAPVLGLSLFAFRLVISREQRAHIVGLTLNSKDTVRDSPSQHVVWTLELTVWTLAVVKSSSQRVSKRGNEALSSSDRSRF